MLLDIFRIPPKMSPAKKSAGVLFYSFDNKVDANGDLIRPKFYGLFPNMEGALKSAKESLAIVYPEIPKEELEREYMNEKIDGSFYFEFQGEPIFVVQEIRTESLI